MVHSEKAQTNYYGYEQSLNHWGNLPPRPLTVSNLPTSGLRLKNKGCILPSKMKTLKIFPRKTMATPDDENTRIGFPQYPMFENTDRIQISVAFTWDISRAERMAKAWSIITKNIDMGGPAFGHRGNEFIPGQYLKKGYVITSRGCPNRCWFCSAWKNEGNEIRELPIYDGWNLLDNNIFACSKPHQEKVYQMLLRQPFNPRFTGGLEAARFTEWHADWLLKLKPTSAYFAYDEELDFEPLVNASKILNKYGILKNNIFGCYVLIGYKGDAFHLAENRLNDVMKLGFFPQAMLYDRGKYWPEGEWQLSWKRFQREWANKKIVGFKMRNHDTTSN